jgi:hypothetical protein
MKSRILGLTALLMGVFATTAAAATSLGCCCPWCK